MEDDGGAADGRALVLSEPDDVGAAADFVGAEGGRGVEEAGDVVAVAAARSDGAERAGRGLVVVVGELDREDEGASGHEEGRRRGEERLEVVDVAADVGAEDRVEAA